MITNLVPSQGTNSKNIYPSRANRGKRKKNHYGSWGNGVTYRVRPSPLSNTTPLNLEG